jgi:tetratricopeptide (TPR) repeat protein
MRRAAAAAALSTLFGLTLLAPPTGPAAARADVIYLKDGTKIEGEILRKEDAGWVIKTPDGKVTTVESRKVRSFEAKRGNGAEEGLQRLVSLRRSVESQTDIPKVLARYRKFVEQHVGTPVADEAAKDIAVWEERLAKGMVKLGDRWIDEAEQEAAAAKAAEQAVAARRLLLQGRTKDARAAIDSALAEYPQNAAALYLRGVALYRQQDVPAARKAFEAVLELVPDHAASLNNLGVILWSNKQMPAAINAYGQAMNADPGTRAILDNVAEALNGLPESQRDNDATEKVVLMFNAQDMALQGRMKKRGLFRWGSTWVKEDELEQLEAAEAKIEDRLDALEEEYQQAKERVGQIEQDIADTERSIRRIEASSYGRDQGTGRATRFAYPRLYYDLRRDLENLHDERGAEKEKLARLRKRAKIVQQEIAVPRYTGTQQIIGVEGAPGLPALTADELQPDPNAEPAPQPGAAPEAAVPQD